MIDTTTTFGDRAARRLHQEALIWLTTVRHDLTPQPSPVWFYWNGETILIYSQPNTPKLRNIAQNPKVALNLNGDTHGNDIVIVSGNASIDADAPPAHEVPGMVQKYLEELHAVQSAEDFARTFHDYNVAIRITPTRLRGF